MKKYWLTFKDQRLERQYQQSILHYQRDSIFKIASYSILIIVAIKIIVFALQWKLMKLVSSVIIFAYLFLQYQFVRKKSKYLRLAAVILNHVAQIYQIWDNQSDPQMAMLQGINTMAFTTIVALVGEYVDGVITIINLTIYRIVWVMYYSAEINWSIMLGQIFLIVFINYFNYQFHRGRRSAFLLTLVDSCSKSIFNKLAKDKPFFLIRYQEEKLMFEVLQENNCKVIYGLDHDFQIFIRNATIGKKLLSQYLQEQYYNYQQQIHGNNQVVVLSYDKRKIKVDLSIHSGEQPQILVMFEKVDPASNLYSLQTTKKMKQLTTFLIKTTGLISRLSKFQPNYQLVKTSFLQIKRKLLIINLLENFHLETKSTKIKIESLIQVIKSFCQGYQLNLNINKEILFETLPLLFYLYLFILFDNSLSQNVIISLNLYEERNIKIHLNGRFNKQRILTMIIPIRERLQIIFQSTKVTDKMILIQLQNEINVPFSIYC